jgi:hypothetical protein
MPLDVFNVLERDDQYRAIDFRNNLALFENLAQFQQSSEFVVGLHWKVYMQLAAVAKEYRESTFSQIHPRLLKDPSVRCLIPAAESARNRLPLALRRFQNAEEDTAPAQRQRILAFGPSSMPGIRVPASNKTMSLMP